MLILKIITFAAFVLVSHTTSALTTEELLPPEQAFKVTANVTDTKQLKVAWQIADGYFLYQNKIKLESRTAQIQLDKIIFPAGKTKHDEFFGDVIIYRDQLTLPVGYTNPDNLDALKLTVHYQGCADIGVCYPPQKSTFDLTLPGEKTESSANAVQQLLKGVQGIKLSLFEDELLPPDQAFQFFARLKDANTLHVNWIIADGYYLYREKTAVNAVDSSTVQLAAYSLPRGVPKYDEAFGQVEIFYHELDFDIPLIRHSESSEKLIIQAKFQGCADRGVCYPPMDKTIELNVPASTQAILPKTQSVQIDPQMSEQDQIIQSLNHDSFWMTLVSFFGFGLLLSFTPCVFPMIPILSGIIVGQNKTVTTRRAFILSLSYVIASAVTYTIFGILAAYFGGNLQASFQQPWVIALFSLIFVALSFSMFGFYHLELPKALQAKLHDTSEKHRDGSFWGAAIMGALSSLIVGPCVAAPLAGALIFIGQTGDAWLGGSALFMMGLGMGVPLLIVGTSAGKLLPKAGHWLNGTKAVFGVLMLAMAAWMLERIVPASVSMFLWAVLLIIPAIYLNALEPLPANISGWYKLWKGIGLIMLVYGILLLIGISSGNHNPLKPLENFSLQTASASEHELPFIPVTSIQDLNNKIAQANTNNKNVMLDFYADWCISCKELEAYTFTDPKVKNYLTNFILLKADVTNNTEADKALLTKFQLIGPPAVLFFDKNGREKTALRVIGYQDEDTFLQTLKHVQN